MAGAMRDAKLMPEEVGHVHAHGASTREGDAAEARAIQRVFGDRASQVPIVAARATSATSAPAAGPSS